MVVKNRVTPSYGLANGNVGTKTLGPFPGCSILTHTQLDVLDGLLVSYVANKLVGWPM